MLKSCRSDLRYHSDKLQRMLLTSIVARQSPKKMSRAKIAFRRDVPVATVLSSMNKVPAQT